MANELQVKALGLL